MKLGCVVLRWEREGREVPCRQAIITPVGMRFWMDGKRREEWSKGKDVWYESFAGEKDRACGYASLDPKERTEAERGGPSPKTSEARQERERRKLLVAAEKAAARCAVQRHTTAPSIDVGVRRGGEGAAKAFTPVGMRLWVGSGENRKGKEV